MEVVDEILRRLVEAAAAEWAARARKVQPLAEVGVLSISVSIVG